MKPSFYLSFSFILIFSIQGCKKSSTSSVSTANLFDKGEAENKFDKDSLKTGKWIEYFSENLEPRSKEDNYAYYRLAEYGKGNPTGSFAYYYKSGELYIEGNAYDVKKTSNLFVTEGAYKTYYKSGKIQQLVTRNKDGDIDGEYTEYFENGDISEKSNYKNGILEESIEYSKDKNVILKYFPNWKNSTNDIDKRVVLFDGFETENDKLFTIYSNMKILNGKLYVETTDNTVQFIWTDFKLDKEKDFEISAEVEILGAKELHGEVGILWGTKDIENLYGIIIEPYQDTYIPYKIFNNIEPSERYIVSSNGSQTKKDIPNH
jgi:antitoxin component YwqK of YwqJK toxin-antitoxin module